MQFVELLVFLHHIAPETPKKQVTHTHTPKVQHLLDEFSSVFEEPAKLPPKRACDHTIPLIPDAKVVNIRPYRLPQHQKKVMEDIIQDLVKKGVIRDSASPYSSPSIMVKKKGPHMEEVH